MKTKPQKLERK